MSGVEQERTTTVVAIVSSNYLLRLGLQKIVENEPWIRLIGQAAHGANLDDILTREQPHIMIIDSEIESDIPELIQKIKAAAPGIKIILLSGIDDVECTRQAFACGVDGLVLNPTLSRLDRHDQLPYFHNRRSSTAGCKRDSTLEDGPRSHRLNRNAPSSRSIELATGLD